jgi:hypothetical protein
LYREAIAELQTALRLAEAVGCASHQALSLMNRGLCRWCLGELDEANADYEARDRDLSHHRHARDQLRADRSRRCPPRARRARARARLLRGGAGDRRAVRRPPGHRPRRLSAGEGARRRGSRRGRGARGARRRTRLAGPRLGAERAGLDRARARRSPAGGSAGRAGGARRRKRRDRFGLAESLELATFSAPDPSAERERLREALAIWREMGSACARRPSSSRWHDCPAAWPRTRAAARAEQRLRG